MSKKNKNVPAPEQENEAVKQPEKKKKKGSAFGRFLRRFFLLLITILLILAVDLYLVLDLVFNGPSEAACKSLTMSLSQISVTKWVPDLFLGAERVAEIRDSMEAQLPDSMTDPSLVVVNPDASPSEWTKAPDGIRLETYNWGTFQAHILLVRDPAQVIMGTSDQELSGSLLTDAMAADAGVMAAVNAGAFTVDEATGKTVPAGLIYASGEKCWDANQNLVSQKGFAGFNRDNILIVATGMTGAEAEAQGIRDGCAYGPVLIVNGEVNMDAYNANSGYSSRTAIGQRADGCVVFVVIDGLKTGSLGATCQDLTDILIEYDVVNACSMDAAASVMMYREAGEIRRVSNDALLSAQESKLPNYWMVRATGKE